MGKRPRRQLRIEPPSNRIKEWRLARDLTLEQLAERMDSTVPTVSQHERRKAHVTLGQLLKYAEILDVPVTELLPPMLRRMDDDDGMAAVYEKLPPGRRKDVLGIARGFLKEEAAEFAAKPRDRSR